VGLTGPDEGGAEEGGGWGQTEGAARGGRMWGGFGGGGGSDVEMGGGRWGARRTGRVYTLSNINNIWNLTNTIDLKHPKTVAHADNKF
jgi:hypothetical protein